MSALHTLYAIFLEAAQARKRGEVWQGPSGRWFTISDKGRAVPAKAPNADTKPAKTAAAARSPKKAEAPPAKEADGLHAQIADALKKTDPKTLAKVAKMLGIPSPAKAKPAAKPKKAASDDIHDAVKGLEKLAGEKDSSREDLAAGLEKLALPKLSKDEAIDLAKKLGRKAATKAQAVDQIRRHVLERKEILHSADS